MTNASNVERYGINKVGASKASIVGSDGQEKPSLRTLIAQGLEQSQPRSSKKDSFFLNREGFSSVAMMILTLILLLGVTTTTLQQEQTNSAS